MSKMTSGMLALGGGDAIRLVWESQVPSSASDSLGTTDRNTYPPSAVLNILKDNIAIVSNLCCTGL